MKIFVQWSTLTPEDWQEIDSSEWSSLPQGPVPDNHTLSNEKLWIHAVNVQGIVFMGYDHYAVEEGLKVTVWNDDPTDWGGDFHAFEWFILEPALDPKIGKINTRQSFNVYIENPNRIKFYDVRECNAIYEWKDFIYPSITNTRHGIWVPDELNEAHKSIQAVHGWREW